MKNKKIIFAIILCVAVLFALAACIPGDGTNYAENPAGFFRGLWHGLIVWISFIIGLFTGGDYAIYEAFNNGWRYNLGFLIGVSAHIGGISGGLVRINIRRH